MAQTVITSSEVPVWGKDLTVVEELRIGHEAAEEAYMLGRVAAVATTRTGDIWVADGSIPQIRVYDSAGRHVRDVGGPGRGPGEYSSILGMERVIDDRIAVWDPANRRISVFEASGDFVVSHPVDSGTSGPGVFQVDDNGRYYVKTLNRTGQRQENGDLPMQFIVVGEDGNTVGRLSIPPPTLRRGFVYWGPSGTRGPFLAAWPSVITRDGLLATGDNAKYEITFRRGDETVKIIRRHYEVLSVIPQERRQWRALGDYLASQGGFDFGPIPNEKPAFRRMKVDPENRIWVDRYVKAVHTERPPREGRPVLEWTEDAPTYDVLGTDGTFYGQVVLPAGTYIYQARGRLIWAEREAEDGAPVIVRLRIQS